MIEKIKNGKMKTDNEIKTIDELKINANNGIKYIKEYIIKLRMYKGKYVENNKYEESSKLRDLEKELLNELSGMIEFKINNNIK